VVWLTGTLFLVFPDFSCGSGRATCYHNAGDGSGFGVGIFGCGGGGHARCCLGCVQGGGWQ
jgi:hypothetical protein